MTKYLKYIPRKRLYEEIGVLVELTYSVIPKDPSMPKEKRGKPHFINFPVDQVVRVEDWEFELLKKLKFAGGRLKEVEPPP